jgi:cell division protein FtsI/penicillin-binding protein 2
MRFCCIIPVLVKFCFKYWGLVFLIMGFFLTLPLSGEPLKANRPGWAGWVFDRQTQKIEYFGETVSAQLYPVASVAKVVLALHVLEQNPKFFTKTIYCEGPLKQTRNPAEILCYDYHNRVRLKEALAFSCNAYFKALIAEENPQAILKTFQRYGWALQLRADASLNERWNVFLGVAQDSQVSVTQILKILQNITESKQYPHIRAYLEHGRKVGTTQNLQACESLGLIGKTGTKLLDAQTVLGVFAGWAPETHPRYFVFTQTPGSRGKDVPVKLGCEILKEVLKK